MNGVNLNLQLLVLGLDKFYLPALVRQSPLELLAFLFELVDIGLRVLWGLWPGGGRQNGQQHGCSDCGRNGFVTYR